VTGLLDREAFRARLDAALTDAAAGERRFAVCIVEVDGFQDIGRRLGQPVAGRLLRVLADLLQRRAGASALIARLRGAGFGVLLPAPRRDTGWRFASHFLSAVNKTHLTVAGHEVTLTVSIGVLESDHSLTTVAEVMRAADEAHKAATDDGGGCARVYIPEGVG
jgi:diguanylate cyclase (GGDEF)-like protein